jgi:hypothetical protein
MAMQLLGFYRKSDTQDPETYAAGVAALLTRYPEDIVRVVCGPLGLARSVSFLPTLKEVSDALEKEMRPRYEAASREAERKRVAALIGYPMPPTPEDIERVDQLVADLHQEIAAHPDPLAANRSKLVGELTKAEAEAKLASFAPITRDSPEAASLRRVMALYEKTAPVGPTT